MARLFDDAASEFLRVETAVITATPYTMHCWFNTDNITTDQWVMWLGDKGEIDEMTGILTRGATGGDPVSAFSFSNAAQTSEALSTSGYSANTWHAATAVFSADNHRKIYLDGVGSAVDTTAVTILLPDRTQISGGGDFTPGAYFSGQLAEAGIWNVALTDKEVAILAQGYSPRYLTGRLPNLVLYKSLRDLVNVPTPGHISPDMTASGTTISNHPPNIIDPPVPATRLLPAVA